jgi:eukaryotic-like serine/threonine-protein kinase
MGTKMPCPSDEQLELLLEEQLSDIDQSGVALHVSDCARCQSRLESMTETDASLPSPTLVLHRKESGATAVEPLSPFLARLKESSALTLLSGSGTERPNVTDSKIGAKSFPVLPGYEIIAELGRGGMGIVYKARQTGLNRLVALKMILAGRHARPKDRLRFRQEAEAVASLHHPNIVQIHDISESDGVPYLVFEYVEEGSLVQRLRGDPQDLKPAVRLVEVLARTVHFAHQRGIVHRDLKPANILLENSEVIGGVVTSDSSPAHMDHSPLSSHHSPLTSYQPKITDFGLAKRLDENDTGPSSGEIIGTPSYMAPEQAGSKANLISPATDVYALGAILYEMFTGRPPFKGATPLDTVVQVVHEEPVRPRSLRSNLPLDLETICLKCLNKEPSRRYVSAEALADDLQRYLKGKPIMARPVGPVERAWKWSRRRPLTTALLVGMILSVVLGFAGVTWQWREATWARDVALGEKRDKEIQRQQARTALYFSRIAQSQLQWRVNNVIGARESLLKCRPLAEEEDQRGWEWHYLNGLFHSDLFTLYHTQNGIGGAAAFHPDGHMIASVVGGQTTEDDSHPGEVRFWDAKTGALIATLQAPSTAHRLVFRPDGARLALATTTGSILIWDTASGKKLLRTPPDGQMIPSLAFSPDGQMIASASWDQTVKIMDADTGKVLQVLQGHGGPVQSVAFHPDGKRLASGDGDATVKVWDLRTGQDLLTLRGHKSPVYGVAFSPNGELLGSGSSNGNLKIWELASGRAIQSFTSQSGAVFGNCFSPDGRYLAYCGGDATVRVWDLEAGIQRMTFRGHTGPVESVQFSPDGQRLVSCSPQESDVKVWDLTRHPEFSTFARLQGRGGEQTLVRDLTLRAEKGILARTGPDIEALAFHADGKHLVSVGVGGDLQIWDANSGVLIQQRSLPMYEELITPAILAAFSPDGKCLVGRSRADKTLVKMWTVADGRELLTLRGHNLPVFVMRFSADGQLVVNGAGDTESADRNHEVIVWDAHTGKNLAAFTGTGLLVSVAFSADNRWIALGGEKGTIMIADWKAVHSAGKGGMGLKALLSGHRGYVGALAFSSNGRLLASAGVEDRMVKIWELDGFQPAPGTEPRKVHTLTAPPLLCDLAFTPDNKRLAGISRDMVKIWDVETHQEILALRGAPQRHWDPAFNPRVAFSLDGKRLAGTNWNESISMWDAGSRADQASQSDAEEQRARQEAAEARAAFWHLEEAEDCLNHHNLYAARFHFQRLGSATLPGPLQARKEKVARELEK